MESMQGHVESVMLEVRGDQAEAAASVGATSIAVYDLADFDETGGWIRVNDTTVQYTATVGDDDTTTRTLTLATALTVAVAVDDRVDVWNPETSTEVAEWVATVVDDVDGGQIQAPIAHELIALLGEGIRGLVGESVVCVLDETGAWTVTQVLGKTPSMDGAVIEPGTIGEPTVVTAPPATSPTLTVVPLAESFILRTAPIDPTTWLTYEVSTDDGATWAALPDMPVRTTVHPARRLSDGSAFAAGTTYTFRVTAGNVRGSAAPSASQASQLDPSLVAQVAQQLIADEVIAGFVLAGVIEVGGNTFTLSQPGAYPDDPERNKGGLRIELTNGGLIHLPADGSAAVLTGHVTAESLNVVNGAEIAGVSRLGGDMKVGATIADPSTAPTVSAYYTYQQLKLVGGDVTTGLCRNVAGNGWVTVNQYGFVAEYLDATLTASDSASPNPADVDKVGGVTRIGSSYYVLTRAWGATDSDYRWYITKFDSALTYVTKWQSAIVTTTPHATIGTNGTDLIIAWISAAGIMQAHRVNPADGSVIASSGISWGTGLGSDLGGVYSGTADVGAARWFVQPRTSDVKVFNGTTRDAANEWPRAYGGTTTGLWWDGANFWTITTGGVIAKLEAPTLTGTQYWSYAYVDSDTHTTGPSPQKMYIRPKRANVYVTAPAVPQESATGTHIANRIQIYAATTSGGTKYPQGSPLAAGTRGWVFGAVTTTGTPAPANNWAAVTVPGKQYAEIGGHSIDGNSNGDVGTGTYRGSIPTRLMEIQPYGKVQATASQSVNHNTPTTIDFGSNVEAVGITADHTNDRIVVATAGIYDIEALVVWQTNATGSYEVRIMVGATIASYQKFTPLGTTPCPVKTTRRLAAGDVLTVVVVQTSGAALSTAIGVPAFLQAIRVL